MYPKEMNEKLGKLQDLLESQGKLQNEIRNKKMFIEEDLKSVALMRRKSHLNTVQINELVKELGKYPLADIETEEEKEEPILIQELHCEHIQV